jgi:hypothetical protein
MTHLEVARLLLSTASTLHSHMVQQQAAGVAPPAALRCAALSKRILDTLQTPIAKDEQVWRGARAGVGGGGALFYKG